MSSSLLDRSGGAAIALGAVLFAVYASLFSVLLPLGHGEMDFAQVVRDPNWVRLALAALTGILLMLYGFYAVYDRLRGEGGVIAAVGFLFVELAYLMQACKVTWELFVYPVIAGHEASAFLLRDGVLKHDSAVLLFRLASSVSIFIGICLFCLSLYRSRHFPNSAAILIFAGALIYGLGPIFSLYVAIAGILILAVGCGILGVSLIKLHAADSFTHRHFKPETA
jgi:hypothetical protein